MQGIKLHFGVMALALALSGAVHADDAAKDATDAAVEKSGEDSPKIDADVNSDAKPLKKAKAKRATKKAMKNKKAQKTEANAAPVSDSVATQAAANEPSAEAAQAAVDSVTPASTPVQTSASDSAAVSPLSRFSASYTMWITGPTMNAIDGVEGEGSGVALDQFATIGYKASSKWKLSVTQPWKNTIRGNSEGKRNLEWQNLYFTAANSSFTKSTKYGTNLSGYVRYYAPTSHTSADNVGKTVDTKYGVVRAVIDPTKTFMDGKLTLSGATYIHRTFAGAKPDSETGTGQRDWRIYLYPAVRYAVTDTFEPYVAYFNDLEHFRLDATRQGAGRWRSFNEKHLIEIGVNWSPVKNLALNPYIEYGPRFQPRHSTVNLIAEYAFL